MILLTNFFEVLGVVFTAILAIIFGFILWGFFKVRAEMKKKPTSAESSQVEKGDEE